MTTTPSARAREAAADVLDEISALLGHDGIGQAADLIRDFEYDEHDVMPIFARFEAEIREQCARELDHRALRYTERASQTSDNEIRELRNQCAMALEFAAAAIRENRP
tara:strand:- start:3133 stop:3456 length:324 start_codon:yes stop_codon:yes gene_type:complete